MVKEICIFCWLVMMKEKIVVLVMLIMLISSMGDEGARVGMLVLDIWYGRVICNTYNIIITNIWL